MSITKTCKIDDCDRQGKYYIRSNKRYLIKGMCGIHYRRSINGVNLHAPSSSDDRPAIIDGDAAKIPLGVKAKDGYATVDKRFAHLDQHKWNLGSDGYPRSGDTRMHIMIIGKVPQGMVTDHINRNKLDNRSENLRITTYYINAMNASKMSGASSSFRGVCRLVLKGKVYYRASVSKDSRILQRNFRDERQAASWRDEAAIALHGSSAILNFPSSV